MLQSVSPTTGRKWVLRKRYYPLSPTWQVRGQTCCLLAEQETCFLSFLACSGPGCQLQDLSQKWSKCLGKEKKCFSSLLHREGESVRWYEAENRQSASEKNLTRLGHGGVGTYSRKRPPKGNVTLLVIAQMNLEALGGVSDGCYRKRSHWKASFSSVCLLGSVNFLAQSRPWTKAKDLSRNSKPCTKMILGLEQKKGTLREFKEQAHAPRWLLAGYFERRLGHISPLCFSQGPFTAWFLPISVFQSFGSWKS